MTPPETTLRGTGHRSRPRREGSAWPGSTLDRYSRKVKLVYGWFAMMFLSAGARSTSRAAPCPECQSASERSARPGTGPTSMRCSNRAKSITTRLGAGGTMIQPCWVLDGPGPPIPRAGSRSSGSGATGSPAWNSMILSSSTPPCMLWPAMLRHRPVHGLRPAANFQPVLRFPAPHLVAATFEQIIGPCKPVVGVVRLKGSGKPLAGVRIYGYGRTPPVRVETQTDADGRFRLLGLPKSGSYEIRAAPRSGVDPFLGTTITITDTAGLEPIEAVLELPKGVIVAGRVIDSATGRPERVHELNYSRLPTNWNEGDTATGHSGATDPTFRITVPPGEGVIRTQVRGWETPYSWPA